MNRNALIAILVGLFALLASLPFLVPHAGFLMLSAFVPLLCAEEIARETEMKRFWVWHYSGFVLWNAATTFWVCNATVGGGIFAVLANALQMSLIFGLFRWSRKYIQGALPYLFLLLAWIAWERYYLTWAQISWPWLVLGNGFARTTGWVQWYEYTGTLGGSLWIWGMNLAVYGIVMALGSGRWHLLNGKARAASIAGALALLLGPVAVSGVLLVRERHDLAGEPAGAVPAASSASAAGAGEALSVIIAQPNFDPYHKFEAMTQAEQTAILLQQFESALQKFPAAEPVLLIAPETFTGDIIVGDVPASQTYQTFKAFLSRHPNANLLFGASTYDFIESFSRPSRTARACGEGQWYESHNSALLMDSTGRADIFHKSKLVVGVELTPYPAVFRPVDDWLGGVMGRCVGQPQVTNLFFREYIPGAPVSSGAGAGGAAGAAAAAPSVREIPIGCAICYESVYGEYCTGYIRKGARLLTIITNDAWWKDTPGYRQHLSYAALRAIETRRWIARCGNTGISAIIDPTGRIVRKTAWWQPEVLTGRVSLSGRQTWFVRHGDYIGRFSIFLFILLLLSVIVRALMTRR